MARPPSVVKINRDGVVYTSSVDRALYTIEELERAALQETARFLRRRILDRIRRMRGMRRGRRPYSSTQYWVRRRETDLLIGFKHDSWYGARQELGDKGQPRLNVLRDTVFENVDTIRMIQGKYLSAIEDENRALGLINEGDMTGDRDE